MTEQEPIPSDGSSRRVRSRFWMACSGVLILLLIFGSVGILRYYGADRRVEFTDLKISAKNGVAFEIEISDSPDLRHYNDIIRQERTMFHIVPEGQARVVISSVRPRSVSPAGIRDRFYRRRISRTPYSSPDFGSFYSDRAIEPGSLRFLVHTGATYVLNRDEELPFLEYRQESVNAVEPAQVKRLVIRFE